MKRRWIPIGIAIALVSGVLVFMIVEGAKPGSAPSHAAGVAPRPKPTHVAAAAAPSSVPPLVDVVSSTTRKQVPLMSEPLPPSDSLVVSHFARMRERAFAGDPRAACRVAFDISYCTRGRSSLVFRIRNQQSNLNGNYYSSERERLEMVEYVQVHRQALARLDQVCAGFTPAADELPVWQYSLAAALGGSVPEMGRFLLNDGIGLDFVNPEKTLEGWQAYNRHALQIFEAYKRTGDAAAYVLLSQAYGGNPDFLFGVEHPYPRNRLLSFAYMIAALLRVPRAILQEFDPGEALRKWFPDLADNASSRHGAEVIAAGAIESLPAGRGVSGAEPPPTAIPGEMHWAERCEEISR